MFGWLTLTEHHSWWVRFGYYNTRFKNIYIYIHHTCSLGSTISRVTVIESFPKSLAWSLYHKPTSMSPPLGLMLWEERADSALDLSWARLILDTKKGSCNVSCAVYTSCVAKTNQSARATCTLRAAGGKYIRRTVDPEEIFILILVDLICYSKMVPHH